MSVTYQSLNPLPDTASGFTKTNSGTFSTLLGTNTTTFTQITNYSEGTTGTLFSSEGSSGLPGIRLQDEPIHIIERSETVWSTSSSGRSRTFITSTNTTTTAGLGTTTVTTTSATSTSTSGSNTGSRTFTTTKNPTNAGDTYLTTTTGTSSRDFSTTTSATQTSTYVSTATTSFGPATPYFDPLLSTTTSHTYSTSFNSTKASTSTLTITAATNSSTNSVLGRFFLTTTTYTISEDAWGRYLNTYEQTITLFEDASVVNERMLYPTQTGGIGSFTTLVSETTSSINDLPVTYNLTVVSETTTTYSSTRSRSTSFSATFTWHVTTVTATATLSYVRSSSILPLQVTSTYTAEVMEQTTTSATFGTITTTVSSYTVTMVNTNATFPTVLQGSTLVSSGAHPTTTQTTMVLTSLAPFMSEIGVATSYTDASTLTCSTTCTVSLTIPTTSAPYSEFHYAANLTVTYRSTSSSSKSKLVSTVNSGNITVDKLQPFVFDGFRNSSAYAQSDKYFFSISCQPFTYSLGRWHVVTSTDSTADPTSTYTTSTSDIYSTKSTIPFPNFGINQWGGLLDLRIGTSLLPAPFASDMSSITAGINAVITTRQGVELITLTSTDRYTSSTSSSPLTPIYWSWTVSSNSITFSESSIAIFQGLTTSNPTATGYSLITGASYRSATHSVSFTINFVTEITSSSGKNYSRIIANIWPAAIGGYQDISTAVGEAVIYNQYAASITTIGGGSTTSTFYNLSLNSSFVVLSDQVMAAEPIALAKVSTFDTSWYPYGSSTITMTKYSYDPSLN